MHRREHKWGVEGGGGHSTRRLNKERGKAISWLYRLCRTREDKGGREIGRQIDRETDRWIDRDKKRARKNGF